MTLEEIRPQIDTVDKEIRELFIRRMHLAEQVARVKAQTEDTIYKPDREKAILENRSKGMEEDLKMEYRALLKRVMEVSRKYQYGLTLQMRDCFPYVYEEEEPHPATVGIIRDQLYLMTLLGCDGALSGQLREIRSSGSSGIHGARNYEELADLIEDGSVDEGIGVTADNNEVEFVAYSSSDLAIALNNGAVDVIGAHDPIATKGELAYGFRKILDTGTDEKFVSEYCCQQFVTHKLLKENPEGAAAVTRALMKASAFVEAEPREVAKLQIENNLVAGDLDFNAGLLEELNYKPSRLLGKKTFEKAAKQLQEAGILKKTTDLGKFVEKGFIDLSNVPDGYEYDKETKTYKEI